MDHYCTILNVYIKDIKFSMRFRTYILIAVAGLWFVLGAMFLYRSCWDLEDSKMVNGSIVEIGIKEFDEQLHQFALCFKVHGSDQTFGIYQRKNLLYTEQLNMLHIGDSVKVYYGDWKLKAGAVNRQLVHVETKKHVVINYADRKYKDRWLGSIFFLVSFTAGGFAWYLFKKKPIEEDPSLMFRS
jgi:hypothetical protein